MDLSIPGHSEYPTAKWLSQLRKDNRKRKIKKIKIYGFVNPNKKNVNSKS